MRFRKAFTIIITMIAFRGILAFASDNAVVYFGDFKQVSSIIDDHCYGHHITLWKHRGLPIGFFYHENGLCGDSPMGILEETKYSSSTGALSFRTKMSEGCTLEGGKCVPTKDIVVFQGKLKGNVLEGQLSWYREGNKTALLTEQISLLKDTGPAHPQSFASLKDWMNYWSPVLKFRGPKW